jgi:hypothetical protein
VTRSHAVELVTGNDAVEENCIAGQGFQSKKRGFPEDTPMGRRWHEPAKNIKHYRKKGNM